MKHGTKQMQRGSILVITIVFMGVFAVLFSSLVAYLVMVYRYVDMRTESEQAFQIAEAGIEYYRWHLAHWPDDIQDGTGAPGPYVHVYEDPESGPIGEFSLEIGGEVLCGKVQVIHATSTGYTYADPENTRTIVGKIARPTVADYSYIVDSHVYAGSSRIVLGPYHSNGVVRMDGDNRSAVTSKVTTADCATVGLGGCAGTINGVYGAGTHPEWWRSGQQEIPFSNFDYDFDAMAGVANAQGIYLPKVSNDTTSYGYYLELKDDRTVDIYEVTGIWSMVTSKLGNNATTTVPELVDDPGAGRALSTYRTFIENRPIPQSCPLIYVSDRTWIEGEVSGKVTVVANDTGAASPDVFLQDNITYSTTTGADGLTVLAEQHLLIPLYVPNDMTISGIFFAQKGAYGRNWYEDDGNCSTCTSVNPYDAYKEQHSLTTNGTVVSKLRTGTQWGTVQGFENRYDNYDRNLAKSPPPMTPFTSPDFRFIEWREMGVPMAGGSGGGGGGGSTPTFISFVASATNDAGAATSITVPIPAGSALDDVMIATVIRNANGTNAGAWGTPAGWTQLYEALDTSGEDRRTAVYYKVHDGSEADPVFPTNCASNEEVSGMIHTYRDVDTSQPLDVAFAVGSHKLANSNDATPPNASITTATANAWVLVIHFATHDDITASLAPSSYTMRGTIVGGTKDNRQQFLADKLVATPGLESPGDWGHTDNQNPDVQEYTTVTIALKPAP